MLAWAADSCFPADLSYIFPGQPVLLAWDDQGGSWWDALLNTNVTSQASLVGSIPCLLLSLPRQCMATGTEMPTGALFWTGNVTQNAVVWLPLADMADADPNKLYTVKLWDPDRGTSCISEIFRFRTSLLSR